MCDQSPSYGDGPISYISIDTRYFTDYCGTYGVWRVVAFFARIYLKLFSLVVYFHKYTITIPLI